MAVRAKRVTGRGQHEGLVSWPDRGISAPVMPLKADTSAMPPGWRIEIEPTAAGGFINGRHELWVRGRVIGDLPVRQITMTAAGQILSQWDCPPRHNGSLSACPDRIAMDLNAFAVALARPKDQAAAPIACVVTAQFADNVSYQASFLIEVDPTDCTRGSVVSGLASKPDRQANDVPPLMLYVEQAVIDPGRRLLVSGWVLTQGSIAAIQIFSNGHRLGVAQIGQPRADVAQAHPRFANAGSSGFILDTILEQKAAPVSDICIEAITLQGVVQDVWVTVEQADSPVASERLQVNLPVPDPRREIKICCEVMSLRKDGELTISGWAVCAAGISRAEVLVDGELAGDAELVLPRPDVAEEFKHIPMARFSGLHFSRQRGLPMEGAHEISLRVHNGLNDVQIETRTVKVSSEQPITLLEPLPITRYEAGAFHLKVETPAVIEGAALYPASGMLTVQGWAFAELATITVEVFIDDVSVGEAYHGLPRPDVAEAFPPYANALHSGFIFRCPVEHLPDGEHTVHVEARTGDKDCVEYAFRITVQHDGSVGSPIQILRQVPPAKARVYTALFEEAIAPPSFRLVLRACGPLDLSLLRTTLNSLAGQLYGNWTLVVLASDPAARSTIRNLVTASGHAVLERLDFVRADELTFSSLTRRSLSKPTALEHNSMFCFLCPGDELGCDALAEVALFASHYPADIIYADEARISPVSGTRAAFFKPDWSPDLLLSTNYIGRPWFVAGKTLWAAGVTPRTLHDDGEYDAVLRCTEQATTIEHLNKLLCWRGPAVLDDVSQEQRALRLAAERRRLSAKAVPACIVGTWRFQRTLVRVGLVSIIIPTCAKDGHIKRCIDTLRAHTTYRNFELICVDNIKQANSKWKLWLRQHSDLVVNMPGPFNWSRFNNVAAGLAAGEYLLFLNDDIEITHGDWLDAMLEHAQRSDVGVVGAQLLYPNGRVQHAGMFLAAPGTARHAFRMLANDDPGYFGLALTQRNVIAVTGACMLVKRKNFQRLGGFDESHAVVNNDLDYCLRSHKLGLLTVFTPYATLTHHEAASRAMLKESFDQRKFRDEWWHFFAEGDPYFNLRLSRQSDDYRPDDEPLQDFFAGGPVFWAEDIKRILVVKLDHIGDFITATPAMRRLKQLFPKAFLHVLTGRANKPLAEMERCIDGVIEFEFFHPRSELGQKELVDANFYELTAQLAPYQFDLAIDLRRHPDTRRILRHVPARYRAGFDHAGQFPFMDISLEATEDIPLRHKNAHISDVLLHLVEAIGHACNPLPQPLLPSQSPGRGVDRLPVRVRRLFRKPVAILHPGVGSSARQWPPTHFAALADLLVRNSGLNVVLVGDEGERPLADLVMKHITARQAVASLVGQTSLKELCGLLEKCVLYVGNNSGPQHIAAALGIPTVGVHSGAVDAREWGPVGAHAVALQRKMLCGPCYLTKAEDCVRNLACLQQLEPRLVHQYCEMLLRNPPKPTRTKRSSRNRYGRPD